MGRVYLGYDSRHQRDVAIKVLVAERAELLGRDRFLREIAITARLNHPHIVPIFDSGESEGQLYYVMPYIRGETLRERLRREPMLPLPQVLRWAQEIAEGIDAAHAEGVVHRDIKPENLLIQDGHILVADFGLARALDLSGSDRLTRQSLVLGTPPYMSPEQATGAEHLDGRSDVFSLACVVHEMLTGSPPFVGPNAQVLTALKLAEHYPSVRTIRPALSPNIDLALTEALRAQPADRLSSGAELVQRLNRSAVPRSRLRALWPVPAAVVLAAGALALAYSPGAPPASVLPARPRIVVDVFANRTGDPDSDLLGVMAEDWLIEGLQRTDAVDVVPTLTAIAATRYVAGHAGGDDPVRSLAAETGANLVVTGAIYREQTRVVIQAQLVDPVAGKVLGAIEPVGIPGKDTGEGLKLLRTRVMGLLALRLDSRAIAGDRPPRYEAYLAFSQGLDAYTRAAYDSALAAFVRSNQADTGFVLPLIYASICLSNRGDFAGADSVVRLLRDRGDDLTQADRYWLDHRIAELSGNDAASLEALRKAALQSPGTKATYNFAVQAYEARLPFPAESALRQLSPDRGAMRGWLPYWDVLAGALHAQRKYKEELTIAREAWRRFPGQMEALAPLTRALATRGELAELERLWLAAARSAAPDPEWSALAYDTGSELVAHGDSSAADRWFSRAVDLSADPRPTPDPSAPLIHALALWRLGRPGEAFQVAKDLSPVGALRQQVLGTQGVLAAAIGNRAEAERLLAILAAESPPFTYGRSQEQAARIAIVLGAPERATGLLELALSRGVPFDDGFHRDRLLYSLRNTSIYQRLSPRP